MPLEVLQGLRGLLFRETGLQSSEETRSGGKGGFCLPSCESRHIDGEKTDDKIEDVVINRNSSRQAFMAELSLTGASRPRVLVMIKLLHTAVWAVMAGFILALPRMCLLQRFDWVVILTLVILAECGVLALNQGRCPLTNLAARCTNERADNFDIFLPEWLARHNKTIFGTLFVVNELIVLWFWLR